MKILLLAPLVKSRSETLPAGFVFGLIDGFKSLGHTCDTVATSGEPIRRWAWDRSMINCQKFVDDVVARSQDYDTVFISKGATIDMPWYKQIVEKVHDITFFDMDPTSGNGCGRPSRPKVIGVRGLLCTRIIATGTEALRWFRQNGFAGRTAQIYEGYRPWLWSRGQYPRENQNRLIFLGSRGYLGDGGRQKKIDLIESKGYELVQNNTTHFQDAADAYWNSAICPNFVCGDITSLRVIHILASGGFCLTEHNMDVEASFIRGQELDWFQFNDSEELLEKIQFYMDRPTLRDEIARRGHEWSKDYTWERQAEKMVEFMEGGSICDGGANEFVS